ncbi:hypothetical protein [Streptomyces sp. CS227]|uniref:hypothetical protein n=1 Tax=Streptomyces sp. CS227 TaxID=1982763 RepID=UPI0015C5B041|nr:hypothetical protein [Streptomyces sp. CS227]
MIEDETTTEHALRRALTGMHWIYLVGLDENRERILEEFGVDTRRASAPVLIGHPSSQPEVSEEESNEALRMHTSHLNRIEVLTYKQLVDSAERALALGEPG